MQNCLQSYIHNSTGIFKAKVKSCQHVNKTRNFRKQSNKLVSCIYFSCHYTFNGKLISNYNFLLLVIAINRANSSFLSASSCVTQK